MEPLLYRVTLANTSFDRKATYCVLALNASEAIETAEAFARSENFGFRKFHAAEEAIPRWVETDNGHNNLVMSRKAYEHFGAILGKIEQPSPSRREE